MDLAVDLQARELHAKHGVGALDAGVKWAGVGDGCGGGAVESAMAVEAERLEVRLGRNRMAVATDAVVMLAELCGGRGAVGGEFVGGLGSGRGGVRGETHVVRCARRRRVGG